MTEILTMPRKEREKEARRQDILDAARSVFSERGFAGATLDEIADAAEFGKGTIYNYFRSKEELFLAVIVRGLHRFMDFLSDVLAKKSTATEKAAAYVDATYSYYETNRQMFDIFEIERLNIARSLTQEMVNTLLGLEEDFLQFLTGVFEQGLRDGDFKKLSARRMAELLRGMTHFSLHNAIRSPETHNLREDAESIKEVFFKGVLKKD